MRRTSPALGRIFLPSGDAHHARTGDVRQVGELSILCGISPFGSLPRQCSQVLRNVVMQTSRLFSRGLVFEPFVLMMHPNPQFALCIRSQNIFCSCHSYLNFHQIKQVSWDIQYYGILKHIFRCRELTSEMRAPHDAMATWPWITAMCSGGSPLLSTALTSHVGVSRYITGRASRPAPPRDDAGQRTCERDRSSACDRYLAVTWSRLHEPAVIVTRPFYGCCALTEA
jgi:hypothetical protein